MNKGFAGKRTLQPFRIQMSQDSKMRKFHRYTKINLSPLSFEFTGYKSNQSSLSGLIICINFFSLRKVAAKFNIVAASAKMLVLATIIIIGAIYLFRGLFISPTNKSNK